MKKIVVLCLMLLGFGSLVVADPIRFLVDDLGIYTDYDVRAASAVFSGQVVINNTGEGNPRVALRVGALYFSDTTGSACDEINSDAPHPIYFNITSGMGIRVGSWGVGGDYVGFRIAGQPSLRIYDAGSYGQGDGASIALHGKHRTGTPPTYGGESYYTRGAEIRTTKTNATEYDYDYDLRFYTNKSGTGLLERMVIDYDGDVGIGTTQTHERLEIGGDGRALFGDGGGNNRKGLLIDGVETYGSRIQVWNYQTASGLDLTLQGMGGSVGIGTTATLTSKLQVVGLQEFDDNADAVNGGLTVGAFYRTGDVLKVVH